MLDATTTPTRRWHALPVSLGILLALLTAAMFWPTLYADFVAWDDALHVAANPRFQPVTWSQILAFWRAPYAHLYIPLTYTTWAVVAWATQFLSTGTLPAGPFHGLNLLLHLGSVLLVFRLGLFVVPQAVAVDHRRLLAAAAGALLFGLHPLQVEAVAWVSGLRDVLCGWWALVALWQYLVSLHAVDQKHRWQHYGLATIAFVLALLAKPAAVALPIMAWLLATLGCKQQHGAAARALLLWVGIALLWGLWTKEQQPDDLISFLSPLWARPVIAADSLGFYLWKLLWPVSLGPDYGRTPQTVLQLGWSMIMGVLPLGFGLVLWWRWHWLQGVKLAAGLFVAGLFPVLGCIPFMFQAFSTVADRYVYLAMLGPALGLSQSLYQGRYGKWVWISLALLLGCLGYNTIQQVGIWQNTITLFTHALQVNSRSILAYNNLGLALAQQGQLDNALVQYRTALQIAPHSAEVHYNLAHTLLRQGQRLQSLAHYAEAIRLKPRWAEAHNNLGNVLDDLGRAQEATLHYQTALRLRPDFAEAYNNLGDALLKQGHVDAAITHFRRAVELKPVWPEAYYNLAIALSRQGQVGEAMVTYRLALHWRPGWPQAALPLAWLLMQQQPVLPTAITEAIALVKQVCQTTDYQHAAAVYLLAVTYQTAGQEARARATAQHAAKLAKAAGDTSLVTQITAAFPATAQQDASHALR